MRDCCYQTEEGSYFEPGCAVRGQSSNSKQTPQLKQWKHLNNNSRVKEDRAAQSKHETSLEEEFHIVLPCQHSLAASHSIAHMTCTFLLLTLFNGCYLSRLRVTSIFNNLTHDSVPTFTRKTSAQNTIAIMFFLVQKHM